jgi:CheY-like chemotaxis protein
MLATASNLCPAPAESRVESGKGRVLIVDDQIEVAQFLAQMLEMVGYTPVAESSAQAALGLLNEEDFDVVISDFKMPEMTGLEFFHAATEINPSFATRFIFLTGDLYNTETQAVFASIGAPLLGKPFRFDTVEETVGDVVAKNRSLA